MKSTQVKKLQFDNIEIQRELIPRSEDILTDDAMKFLQKLEEKFGNRIDQILEDRKSRQEEIDYGKIPNFQSETVDIRNSHWTVGPLPDDLLDRRVEITGPVDRKMIINGLNSGANVFMADFEDSNSPTWYNTIQGQINLLDAVKKTIEFVKPSGKIYKLEDDPAVLMVRPRGFHLYEAGMHHNDKPMHASLVDFGLYFYHNAKTLVENESGPYFYLPKLQHYREARLWNEIFVFAQKFVDLPVGTIKATVLLEHILAAFQMDEILYELRDHSAGLNCGRWDYIFSFIKIFSQNADYILPDKNEVGMDRHFLNSYVKLLISTCHKREVHAMGGMAAQIPIKHDQEANQLALEKVKHDKLREVEAGHDGTWVAHPGLIQLARQAFDTIMESNNQIDKKFEVEINSSDLLTVPTGSVSEQGVRLNISVGIIYLANWLGGNGCVPINNLMEDAATAEISRSQLWQWVNHEVEMKDGRVLTEDIFLELLYEENHQLKNQIGEDKYKAGRYAEASKLFEELTLREEIPEFLTIEAYELLE